MAEETIRPVPEGRERLFISYGIAIPATAARHVIEIFHATPDALGRLAAVLGSEKIVGRRIGHFENDVYKFDELETLTYGPIKRTYISAPSIPIVSVPTTLPVAEKSNFAGATKDDSRRNCSFQASLRSFVLTILDPELTETTRI
ncbi:uncharacterized protein PFLUO_LOCUS8505 [Penicillium psychrofluorescens]|uniref:uncharacterized protein n=1 Tax=Penicillium psychrofluorescens TaxID=3158075 RepID=UPI003CCDE2B9